MKKAGIFLLLVVAAISAMAARPRVLVFYKTAGFYHQSIEAGLPAIYKLGTENGFDVDSTKESADFSDANLKKYAAIVFLSTTGTLFNAEQQQALQHYVHNGGGIVGIHAATDAEYDWPWYNQMMGAWFLSHPKQQTATLNITDRKHGSTRHLPAQWTRKDEWYNFKNINKDVKVLITIDEKSYEGGKNGAFHPMAWYHNFEGGRVFYTELGHVDESYTDPLFLKHILGGIRYAIGKQKK
ncbi:ThuA domain-containing protein [Niabella beijingensis]|uniref:ThuA domain-containing protein n=1 Tax=Niabella beijingensis TaxID=2872700 RepID=UPI001CBB4B37|nr:ThuA domain-containing protein [Niabella beijingensis]MBZ4188739.1 ThuA domain-containing protein [Niabella beijingensis]